MGVLAPVLYTKVWLLTISLIYLAVNGVTGTPNCFPCTTFLARSSMGIGYRVDYQFLTIYYSLVTPPFNNQLHGLAGVCFSINRRFALLIPLYAVNIYIISLMSFSRSSKLSCSSSLPASRNRVVLYHFTYCISLHPSPATKNQKHSMPTFRRGQK